MRDAVGGKRRSLTTIATIADLRAELAQRHRQGGSATTVGLVPTMGALHAGHRSLIECARDECAVLVVSIFVNPTQFGPGEDFASYPRMLEDDLELCRTAGADVVFAPDADEMYPEPPDILLRVGQVGAYLCGASRPGHFDGVALIVNKLFNVVQPDLAYFGQKDAQQVAVLKRMVSDLNMPVRIVSCPTIREPDGLALSSRNAYLDAHQRKQASVLFASLQQIARDIQGGEQHVHAVTQRAKKLITDAGPCTIDYVELVDPETFCPLMRISESMLAALAVRIGHCRLIDNLMVERSKPES